MYGVYLNWIGAPTCGAVIGWGLVAWVVKGFTQDRTKEIGVYRIHRIHRKGAAGRTAEERGCLPLGGGWGLFLNGEGEEVWGLTEISLFLVTIWLQVALG